MLLASVDARRLAPLRDLGGFVSWQLNADKRTDRVVDAINKSNAASRPAAGAPIPDYVPLSASPRSRRANTHG